MFFCHSKVGKQKLLQVLFWVVINQTLVLYPFMYMSANLMIYRGMSFSPELPGFTTIIRDLGIAVLMEEVFLLTQVQTLHTQIPNTTQTQVGLSNTVCVYFWRFRIYFLKVVPHTPSIQTHSQETSLLSRPPCGEHPAEHPATCHRTSYHGLTLLNSLDMDLHTQARVVHRSFWISFPPQWKTLLSSSHVR